MAREEDRESSLLLNNDEEKYESNPGDWHHPANCSRKDRYKNLALGVSIIANIFLVLLLLHQNLRQPLEEQDDKPSKYAGLTRTRTEPYVVRTPYSSSNFSLQTQLWHDTNVDAGVVALSDDFAKERGLRTAQRFPWDTSKGIYILHGYHNLHCVKIIHIALDEYRLGLEQSRDFHHVSHCVDALRRQVLCDADDTPRATERRREVVTGIGQHRQCRSWDALENWAKQHTACYKRPEKPDAPDAEKGLDRFKHCPEGSGYTIDDDYIPTDEILEGLPAESIEDFVQ